MGVENIFRMHVVLSAGHSPRRWRRREIDRASDPVAAAALVAGTGWIGARWISREAVGYRGNGVGWACAQLAWETTKLLEMSQVGGSLRS